uniref:Uncharacterized protein n=1 Tax=Triticum urartu TaxID=4572 RepID=A0A8R7QTH8_TRIUA
MDAALPFPPAGIKTWSVAPTAQKVSAILFPSLSPSSALRPLRVPCVRRARDRWRPATASRGARRSGAPSSTPSSSASSASRAPSCREQASTTSSMVTGRTTALAAERPCTSPPPNSTPAAAGRPSSKDFLEPYTGRLTLMVGGLRSHAQLAVGIWAMCSREKASRRLPMSATASTAFPSSLLLPPPESGSRVIWMNL